MDFTFFTALFGTLIFFLILFGNIYLSHKKHYDEKVSNCNMSVEGKVLKIVSSYRKIDGELVFTYYPVMGYQVDGKDYALKAFAGSKAIGVNPNCENQKVAVAFAQFLASEDAQKAHYEMRNIVPCNTKLLESDAVKNDALAQAQANTVANTAIIQPANTTFNNNWWNNATTMADSIMNGKVTEENAADQTAEFEKAINGKLE